MKKICKVVMLPTDKNVFSPIYLDAQNRWKKLTYSSRGSHVDKYHHLYILSDEEIKEGDWYIHSGIDGQGKSYSTINYCVKPTRIPTDEQYNSLVSPEFNRDTLFVDGMFAKDCKKIIATTDKSLSPFMGFDTESGKDLSDYIPSIPQSFIDYYIAEYNKGNVITEVEVEYEKYMTDGWIPSYNDPDNIGCAPNAEFDYRLKVNPDNTINIYSIKTSWTKDEHFLDMQYYMEYCLNNEYITPQEWIEKYKHY